MARSPDESGTAEAGLRSMCRRRYLGTLATIGSASLAGCGANNPLTEPNTTDASPCAEPLSSPPDPSETSAEGGSVAWERSVGVTLAGLRLLEENRLLVTTHNGRMLALNRETGATDWESNVTDALGPPMVQGDAIVAQGFTRDEASSRRYAVSDQSIHCIDATTGEERWTALTRDDILQAQFYPHTTTQELALFSRNPGDEDPSLGTMYALSLADGSTRWTAEGLDQGEAHPHDGTIYYSASARSAHRDADVIAFEPDGSRRWEWSPDTDRLFSSVWSAAIVCGHVIVTSAREESDADPEDEYVVHGLDVETGQSRWTLDARTPASLSTHRGRLLVTDDTLRHLDPASGDPVWTVDMGVSAIGYGMVFSRWGTAMDIQDGTTVWDQSFEEPVRMKRVADGRIVMKRRTNESDHIGAIDATTGGHVWGVAPEHEFQTSNGLVVGPQRAYVIDQNDPDNSDPGVTGEYGEKGTVRAVRI